MKFLIDGKCTDNMMHVADMVEVSSFQIEILTGRTGTVISSAPELTATFGPPVNYWPDGDKVKREWYIKTPRGGVCIYDYWWNKPDEFSMRAVNHKAMKWAVRWLKQIGFAAGATDYDGLAKTAFDRTIE